MRGSCRLAGGAGPCATYSSPACVLQQVGTTVHVRQPHQRLQVAQLLPGVGDAVDAKHVHAVPLSAAGQGTGQATVCAVQPRRQLALAIPSCLATLPRTA